MSNTHLSRAGYIKTWAALIVLTGLTLGLSFFVHGAIEIPVALAIATLKAGLVAAFFMHLVEQRFQNRLVLVVSVAFVCLLVGLMVTDVVTRDQTGLAAPIDGR
jgi:cytochrome c oxidase subunit 4